MKIEIREEFLNGKNKLLKIFIFLISDRYKEERENILGKRKSYLLVYYTEKKILKTLLFLKQKYFDEIKKIKKLKLLKEDINSIVCNSKYEPNSYSFIISFFNEVIGGDFKEIYPVDMFIEANRSRMWLLKSFYINFLNIFTNIDVLRKKFLEMVKDNDNKNVLFFYEREKSFLYYLLFLTFPMKNNIKLEESLQDVNISLFEGRVFSMRKKAFTKMDRSQTPYFFEDLENMMSLNNTSNLFL